MSALITTVGTRHGTTADEGAGGVQEYTDATAELRQHLLECCGEECFQQPDQFEALGQKVGALQACRQHPHMLECFSSPTKTTILPAPAPVPTLLLCTEQALVKLDQPRSTPLMEAVAVEAALLAANHAQASARL